MDTIISELKTSKTSKIVFSIVEFRKKRFASIRKYVENKKYQGFTKQGLSLDKDTLMELHNILCDYNLRTNNHFGSDKEAPQYKIEIDQENMIIVKTESLGNKKYIIIQKYISSSKYTGPGHGVGIPYDLLEDAVTKVFSLIENWDVETEAESDDDCLLSDKLLADMWELHRDTRKIAKIMGLELQNVRNGLIKLGLI